MFLSAPLSQMSLSSGGGLIFSSSSSLCPLASCFCGLYFPWVDRWRRAADSSTTRPAAAAAAANTNATPTAGQDMGTPPSSPSLSLSLLVTREAWKT